jgi:3-oxoacyl-[acyl-carrier protein] reductase
MTDTDRVALVTGGSRGIGRAIALELARSGVAVAVNYRSGADAAAAVVADIEAAGGSAIAVGADVGDGDEVTAMMTTIDNALGPVSILVNNAGITDDDLLLRMRPEAWDRVIQTNLTSAYLCTRAALRPMLKARWGRIINVTSVSGSRATPARPTIPPPRRVSSDSPSRSPRKWGRAASPSTRSPPDSSTPT